MLSWFHLPAFILTPTTKSDVSDESNTSLDSYKKRKRNIIIDSDYPIQNVYMIRDKNTKILNSGSDLGQTPPPVQTSSEVWYFFLHVSLTGGDGGGSKMAIFGLMLLMNSP